MKGSGIQLGPVGRRDSSSREGGRSANGAYSVHISADSYLSQSEEAVPPTEGRTIQQTTMVQVAPHRPPNLARRRNHELNNAAWSYTKCSILFFTAILITWIPSSANRVYSVIHKNEVSVVLEFMSAFVLPLQGFWNAVIYAVTSWAACKNLFQDLGYRQRSDVTELVEGPSPSVEPSDYPSSSFSSAKKGRFVPGFLSSKGKPSKPFDTESATELSSTRTNSADGPRN